MQCTNQLRQIGLAIHNYQETLERFPPAHEGKEGQPNRSWRVALLPFFEGPTPYNQYRLDQPWNSPANRKLVSQPPTLYQCPSFGHHVADGEIRVPGMDRTTNYAAILGPETAWADLEADLDGRASLTTSSLLVMDIGPPCIPWTAPRDVYLADAHSRLNPREEHYLSHGNGANFLAVDGSVRFVVQSVSRRELETQIKPQRHQETAPE